MTAHGLSDIAIERFADAVFEPLDAVVLEAYSEFDKSPLQFATKSELVQFIHHSFAKPGHHAFFFVFYPDMLGKPIMKAIHLDQKRVRDGKLRYTWEGWGLISVILEKEERSTKRSHVAANSEARALKWQSTYPDWPSPSTWDWKAIAKHARRLQRVLKKELPNNSFESEALKTTRGSS